MVDWLDPTAKISRFFTVHEAIWLPQWHRTAIPGDGLTEDAKAALIDLFKRMDTVRQFIGRPLYVHCAFRPEKYNELVHGAAESAHMARRSPEGLLIAAVDFSCPDLGPDIADNCDTLRAALLPRLSDWNLRMERNPGGRWIHLDSKPIPPNGERYFLP